MWGDLEGSLAVRQAGEGQGRQVAVNVTTAFIVAEQCSMGWSCK